MYQYISYATIKTYLPEIKAKHVSVKARQPGQFLDQYRQHGQNISEHWKVKRYGFIRRMLAAYRFHKTRRRFLCLICWGYYAK